MTSSNSSQLCFDGSDAIVCLSAQDSDQPTGSWSLCCDSEHGFDAVVCHAAYMNQIKPTPVSEEVAARYPINIFLTYTKVGVRQHTLQSFPPACTPAMLATMMQTGLNNLGDVSPYGVRLLVRTHSKYSKFKLAGKVTC